MTMIQNANMFPDAGPAVLSQSGRGAASALRPSDSGSFARMLQGRQPSRDDAVAGTEPRKQSPSRPGAAKRLQNVPGSPASADGGAEGTQPAPADDATGAQAQLAAQRQRAADNAGEGAAAVAPEPAKGTDLEEQSGLQRDSLAAEAQGNAQAAAAAQQGRAGVFLAAAEGTTSRFTGMEQDAPVAIPIGLLAQSPTGMVAAPGDGPAGSGAGLTSATGEAAVPRSPTPEEAALIAALPSLPDAAKGPRIEQGGVSAAAPLQAKPGPGSPGSETERLVVRRKGADAASLDGLRAASPGVVPGAQQSAEAQGEAGQSRSATDAPEGGREAAASGVPIQGAVVPGLNGTSGQKQEAAQVEAAPAAGTASPDRAAQGGVDRKGPRAADGSHGSYAATRGVTEQADTRSDAPVEVPGIKNALNAETAKLVPSQGSAGQGGFGDAEKKGQPEQKAQANEGAQLQPQGIGLQAPAAAAEAAQAETKPASPRSALHESILSQIKDGVVTHDGKGNGQMSIRLNPGELGELKIQVRMEDNRLRVEVQADNRMVKDLLMSNLDSLKDSLTSKHFTMEGFDVSTGGGGFNSPLSEEKGNPRQQSFLRSARAGAYPDQGEERRVNYLTGDVNNLLDVRF